jgi:hypothetical protein
VLKAQSFVPANFSRTDSKITVLAQKLTITQPVNKLPALKAIQNFTAVFSAFQFTAATYADPQECKSRIYDVSS